MSKLEPLELLIVGLDKKGTELFEPFNLVWEFPFLPRVGEQIVFAHPDIFEETSKTFVSEKLMKETIKDEALEDWGDTYTVTEVYFNVEYNSIIIYVKDYKGK